LALDRYLRVRAEHRHAYLPNLWIGQHGAMTASGVFQVVADRGASVGLSGLHPHQLRHSFASSWLDAGGAEGDLMRLAGWKTRSMVDRYSWHDRRVDAGIDGEIDLRDPATEVALNRLILVQSKAKDQPFTRETATSFEFLCSPAYLAYWMDGNAPVLLVCSHPSTDEAWWVSIRDYFADPTRRASLRVHFDKRTMRFDASAATALFDLAMPAECGLYLPPPPRRELLTSNLLV
jgi:hypothetical protein